MKPKLILLCGLPGSGKSTWAAKHYPNVVATSSDHIRELFYDTREDQRESARVHRMVEMIVEQRLFHKMPITIVDSTNLYVAHRKRYWELAHTYGATPICVWMNIPLGICLRQNVERPHPVPEQVIRDMHTTFEPPEDNEGWRSLLETHNGITYHGAIL